jgi:hypothetical protein
MSRRRKKFALRISIAAALILACGVGLYHHIRRGQKLAAVELILQSEKGFFPASNVGGPSAIPESKRREIYERAIIVTGRVAELDEEKRHDGVTPVEAYGAGLSEAVASAIQRIALGNGVTQGDVLRIVREGSEKDW